MSSKIYFKKSRGFDVRRKLINLTTTLHHRLAPEHAKRVARKVLLTPVRSKKSVEEPSGLEKKPVQTSEGMMMTYSLGEGPTWVLGHGWSGSSRQFYSLMEHIAASGFKALAFDNPAMGRARDGLVTYQALLQHLTVFWNSRNRLLGLLPIVWVVQWC